MTAAVAAASAPRVGSPEAKRPTLRHARAWAVAVEVALDGVPQLGADQAEFLCGMSFMAVGLQA